MAGNPEKLTSGNGSITYASFGADIDLPKAVPAVASGFTATPMGTACRRVRINTATAGALAVQYANGITDVIPNLNSGDQLDVQLDKVLSAGTTGVTSITVIW